MQVAGGAEPQTLISLQPVFMYIFIFKIYKVNLYFQEDDVYKEIIRKYILQPMFIGDNLRFPKDPLGRNGPR